MKKTVVREQRVLLRIAGSPSAAWNGCVREWFQDAARDAWKCERSSLVIAPTRSHVNAWKARLLDERISHLGLRFVTPATLRNLFHDSATDVPAREDLRLLLGVAAEETLAVGDDEPSDQTRAAKAVVRTPAHLWRTLERLAHAGWSFDELRLGSFQPIVGRFRDHLHATGLSLLADVDRRALARGAAAAPLFSRVLVSGFDGAHWPHWFLLRAAVEAAEHATVILQYPDGELEAERYWIGTWEQAFGEATDVSSSAATETDSFFTDEQMRGLGRSKRECTFLVGANTSEQAEAVALQCVRFLAQPNCTRLAVVFAAAGSLPRLVANALAQRDIPHNDAIGHSVPGVFESVEWRAWLQLQQGPRINSLLHFLHALPNRAEIFPQASMPTFERALRSAYSEVLIDDLNVLQQVCAEHSSLTAKAVAEAIRSIAFLPSRGPLREFLAQTEKAFRTLGWQGRWMEIQRRVDERLIGFEPSMSRTLYLRWLGEIASTSTTTREVAGEHPYARVHLLTVPEAQGQEWSHLIFAGWNEGSWPPAPTGEFVRDEEIAAFNGGIRNLNRRAATRGRQGEGHDAVRDGYTFYLGPSEQRQIALRQFESLVHSATAEIAFSANLAQENAPERFWNPSELLTRVYQQTHQKPLTQATMTGLQRATAAWIETARRLTSRSELPSVQIEQTRVAYDARRDADKAAGEYDFAFRSPPARVPIFSVSDLEKLVSTPALIWLKKYLGVEAADETGSPWSAATGMWVHHWLANIAGAEGAESFAKVPTAAEIEQRIRHGAEQKITDVKRLCASAGKTLPDWWNSGWQNALCLARHLGAKISTVEEWRWMATEMKIDAEQQIALPNDRTLSFRGRMDLLLAREEPTEEKQPTEVWILDYKTGSAKPLAPAREDTEKRSTRLHNRLVKGEALQLGLYSLAVRARGASEAFVSIVSSAVRAIEPQLSVTEIGAHLDVFEELARMQHEGVFGMYGALRPPFGYTRPYPLATVAIDPDLLDARWELTHPPLAREEEEWEL